MFNSILSNGKQSPTCHRQLNMWWMNAVQAIITLRARIPCFIDQLNNACVLEVKHIFFISNFHACKFIIVTFIAFNCVQFEVWVANLVSHCREQNRLLSGPTFFHEKNQLHFGFQMSQSRAHLKKKIGWMQFI